MTSARNDLRDFALRAFRLGLTELETRRAAAYQCSLLHGSSQSDDSPERTAALDKVKTAACTELSGGTVNVQFAVVLAGREHLYREALKAEDNKFALSIEIDRR